MQICVWKVAGLNPPATEVPPALKGDGLKAVLCISDSVSLSLKTTLVATLS